MKTTGLVGIGCLAALAATMASPSFAQEHHRNIRHQLLWSGDVDGVIELQVREREVKIHKVEGKSVEHVQAFFKSPLPKKSVTVQVIKQEGRGEVTVFQQPASSNKYTAGVRISDTANGRVHYRIIIVW